MEVQNDLLGYGDMKIFQNTEWFCFSIDSVILARYATVNLTCKKICDFCTGNAPVPLILSTRTKSEIYGIEIQKEIYDLAQKSVAVNKLDSQIKIINCDVKCITDELGIESFDLVTCNPPYFEYSEGSNINENEIKRIARHEILINLEEIIINAGKLLKNKGYFSMVHRPDRIGEIINLLNKYNFGIKTIIPVYAKKSDAHAKLVFLEAMKNSKPHVHFGKAIYLHEENGEYSALTKKLFQE